MGFHIPPDSNFWLSRHEFIFITFLTFLPLKITKLENLQKSSGTPQGYAIQYLLRLLIFYNLDFIFYCNIYF